MEPFVPLRDLVRSRFRLIATLAELLLAVASGHAQSENPLATPTHLSDAQTRRVSSTSADLNSKGDSRVIKQGETLVTPPKIPCRGPKSTV